MPALPHKKPAGHALAAKVRARLSMAWTWFLTGLPGDLSFDQPALLALKVWSRESLSKGLVWLLPLLSVFNVAFWFTDEWAFGHNPITVTAFAQGRTRLLIIAAVIWFANFLWPRRVYYVGAVGATAACLSIGYQMGQIGGPSSPWIHFIYPFMYITLLGWARPWERGLWTVVLGATTGVGYVGLHPVWLSDALAGVAGLFFLFMLMLAFAVGISVDYYRARSFAAQTELEEHRRLLAQRVEEKTAHLRATLARMDNLQDHERSRLARELHDELGQHLTAQRLVMNTLRRRHATNPTNVGPNLTQLDDLIDQTTVQFRQTLRGLRPRILEELGLEAALRSLADHCRQQLNMECDLELPDEELKVSEEVALATYRCLQEAVTNVAKHAQASRVRIEVELGNDKIISQVSDNGVGLQPGITTSSSGFGLLGSRERVEALAGEIEVSQNSTGGTSFFISIPLSAERNHDQSRPG